MLAIENHPTYTYRTEPLSLMWFSVIKPSYDAGKQKMSSGYLILTLW